MTTIREYGQQFGIGGSNTVVQEAGDLAVIDGGVSFGVQNDRKFQLAPGGDYLKGQNVRVVAVSHSHIDHAGAIPRYYREHPNAVFVIARQVLAELEIMLPDSLKIQASDIQEAAKDGIVIEPIFTEDDMWGFLADRNNQMLIIDEPGWYNTLIEGWDFGFSWAGHNPGALSVHITTPSGKWIYVTADAAMHNQEIVDGVSTAPESFLNGFFDCPGGTMITEATNGNRAIKRRPGHTLEEDLAYHIDQIDQNLFDALNMVHDRNGVAFFPAFANNRIPKLVVKLVMARKAGLIRDDCQIWVDGLGRKMTLVQAPEARQWLEDGEIRFFSTDPNKGKMEQEAVARGDYGPCIILSPSATLEKGFAVGHAELILPGSNNALFSTGHIFEGSVTQQIFKLERGRTIKLEKFKFGPVYVNVRCDVFHFDYSAHDSQDGLVERVRRAKPETLIIHHCNDDGFQGLREAVLALPNPPTRIIRAVHMQEIEL